jgi:hypothetical protein
MRLIVHTNQLRRNPNLGALTPDAALEHKVHAEFAANLGDAPGGALVRHAGGAGDHTHSRWIHLAQMAHRFLRKPVNEVFLVRIGG